jgi:stearoyl-CoA desaturase (Delta-9 desaturase)
MSLKQVVASWFDTAAVGPGEEGSNRQIDWARIMPFIGLHLACLAVFVVGVSWIAVAVFAASYLVRMFAITAFYHRYFAHRTFQGTSRPVQFMFALIGAATQRGPLWWAAHHRHHHKAADREKIRIRRAMVFWWSHMGWFLSRVTFATDMPRFRTWFATRSCAGWIAMTCMCRCFMPRLFGLGWVLERLAPGLGTSGGQLLVWGYSCPPWS